MKTQINNHLVLHLKFFSKVFATLVFLVGFLALLGWQFEINLFKRVVSNLPIIAPNTAFSFTLVGLLIFFFSGIKEGHKTTKMLFSFFSALIALLGAATLAEYIFRLNFGIDSFLFAQKMGAGVVRMSPQSAFNFLAVGLALFFYSLKEKKRVFWGQVLIVAAGVTALVSLLGFIYGVAGLYTIAPYKGMAAHTAVAFFLTFLGILTIRPEIGLMRIFVGRGLSSLAARRLILALLAILVIEILVMVGGRAGVYGFAYESLAHLLIITGVFVFLIFYSFRSLDQLAETEKTLEHLKEVDQAKTEFVSLASHQLRTPLTSVSWFSEMLLGQETGTLNPKQRDYLMEIYSQNRRMIDLVDDFLNASKIDMGILVAEPQMTDLRRIIEDILKELNPIIVEKELQIAREIDENFLGAEVDPEFVHIVFENLLSNAVKYTPPRGKITVYLGQSGSNVEIRISDTGYGIPKSQQNRIFTKLFRADNIRDKVTDGTGLGLYIVKAIVKQSGGKIRFESEEGKGTTFFIILPVK